MSFTPVDEFILDTTTRRARLLSPELLVGKLSVSLRSARRLLDRQCSAGWLNTDVFWAASVSSWPSLASWTPDQESPDFNQIERINKQRYARSEPRQQRLYWASKKAARLLGGWGADSYVAQRESATHDLLVANAYLKSSFSKHWLGEDLIGEHFAGTKPDALVSIDGEMLFAVEAVGSSYTALGKLERFHRLCEEVGLAYKLV